MRIDITASEQAMGFGGDKASSKGTYILIVRLDRRCEITIGKKGTFVFSAGNYAYVGSAFGPGGLRARINHHLKKSASPRWHMDYLRNAAAPVQVWTSNDSQKLEHRWAAVLSRSIRTTAPVPGFGSTDCSCYSHLFRLTGLHCMNDFRERIRPRLTRSKTIRLIYDISEGERYIGTGSRYWSN